MMVWFWRLRLIVWTLCAIPLYMAFKRLRGPILRGYAYRSDAAYGGFSHVDVSTGGLIWRWGPTMGKQASRAQLVRPTKSIAIVRPEMGMTDAEWRSIGKPSVVRDALFSLGLLPSRKKVWTCSTMTAAIIGVRRTCRTPLDVLRAIEAKDYLATESAHHGH